MQWENAFSCWFPNKSPFSLEQSYKYTRQIYLSGVSHTTGVYILTPNENSTLRDLDLMLLLTVRVMESFPTQGKTKIKSNRNNSTQKKKGKLWGFSTDWAL